MCTSRTHSRRQRPSAADTVYELEDLLNSAPLHDCVNVPGDFNSKLPRRNGQQTNRWCIHRREIQAGDMLGSLMERKQLCAVSALHQPRRHATNATYLSKDRRYGPSRQRAYPKMGDRQRVESSRAITVSSRGDLGQYVHDVLDDIEMAESVDNMREVSKLRRILGHIDRRGSCNPSKGADGKTITTSTHLLLSEWETFIGTKLQRPAADAHQNLEIPPAENDVLDDDELSVCLKALCKKRESY